jgi:hypothetical protein
MRALKMLKSNKQVNFGITRLTSVIIPYLLILYLVQKGEPSLAHFIVVTSAHFSLVKIMGPFGWDQSMSREIIFEESRQTENANLIKYGVIRTFRNSLIIIPILLTSITFASNNSSTTLNLLDLVILGITVLLVSLNALIMSALKNSSRAMASQGIDVGFNSILPNLIFFTTVLLGEDHITMYCLITMLFLVICLVSQVKLLNLSGIELGWQESFKARSVDSSKQPRGQKISALILGINARLLLIAASWIANPIDLLIIDLFARSMLVVGLVAWAGGITHNLLYLEFPSVRVEKALKQQMQVVFLAWAASLFFIFSLGLTVYQEQYSENISLIYVSVFLVLISFLEIPVATGGYIILQSKGYRSFNFAQSQYLILIIIGLAFHKNPLFFWFMAMFASLVRALLYLGYLRRGFSRMN